MGACPGANERALRKTGNGVEVHSAAARHEYRAWIPCAAHTRRGTCASPCLLLDPMPARAWNGVAKHRGALFVGPIKWKRYALSGLVYYIIHRQKRYIERSTFFIFFIDRARYVCARVRVLLLHVSVSFSLTLSLSGCLILASCSRVGNYSELLFGDEILRRVELLEIWFAVKGDCAFIDRDDTYDILDNF